jgi:hypothetical protein
MHRSRALIVIGALQLALCAACSTFSEEATQPDGGAASDGGGAEVEGAPDGASTQDGGSSDGAPSGALPGSLVTGLIARWRFEDGTGTTAANEVAGSPPGMIVGATFVPGKIGQGLQFNGTSAHVAVPSTLSLEVTNELTFALWMNLAQGDGQRFLARDPIDFKLNGVQPQLSVSGKHVASSYKVPANQWHHVTAVYKDGSTRMFVDGLETTLSVNDAQPTTVPPQTAMLYIGAFNSNTGFANGILDEVCMWKRALTTQEVETLAKLR